MLGGVGPLQALETNDAEGVDLTANTCCIKLLGSSKCLTKSRTQSHTAGRSFKSELAIILTVEGMDSDQMQ